jgi:hypothetical protein
METAKDRPQKDPEPRADPIGEPAARHDVVAKASPVRCPYCHADVRVEADAWLACRGCLARHHVACWQDGGKCSACGKNTALHSDSPARPGKSRVSLALGGLGAVVGSVLLGAVFWVGRSRRIDDRPAHVIASRDLEKSSEIANPSLGAAKPDLSHVRAGQSYVYALTHIGAPPMEVEFVVTEVGVDSVKYTTQGSMVLGGDLGNSPIGDANPAEWRQTRGHVQPASARETIVVGDLSFDCMIYTSGNTTTWVPVIGDLPMFPGVVKMETDGKVTMMLTRVSAR